MPTAPVVSWNTAHLQPNTPDPRKSQQNNGSAQGPTQVSPPAHAAAPREPDGITGAAVTTVAEDRQLYVFCDPVAFRYLEEDTCNVVVARHRTLSGYEVYLVEQWACSRMDPTFVISTYTGDPSHVVSVGVLSIPRDEAHWSPRLRVYFKAVHQFHARPKQTPLGTLMVTNLSSFPSALTVVPVPDGDVRRHREDFIINEDLKRMGCSGRSALSLSVPGDASQTKFHQLFRTSDRIPFYNAIIELVRLCQFSLVMFNNLDPKYADGLLCDKTERGINDWWSDYGTEYYNVEPSDGILGPTTVAALLGMVLGARNRLSQCGVPVPKDAFDLPQLKKAIYHFQRQQRMEEKDRSRRLDRWTMDKLYRATMKSGSVVQGDIFAVPRAIKSTVADLSGRAVGNPSGKTEASSVETVDIEKFVQNLSGERCKYLWQGKPRKSTAISGFGNQTPPTLSRRNSVGAGSISGDDQPTAGLSRESSESPSPAIIFQNHSSPLSSGIGSGSSPIEMNRDTTVVSDLRKAVFKTMTGRMKDVASGISAGADYVRGRGHQRSSTKDFGTGELDDPVGISGNATSASAPVLGIGSIKAVTSPALELNTIMDFRGAIESPTTSVLRMNYHTESPMGSTGNLLEGIRGASMESGIASGLGTADTSAAGSLFREDSADASNIHPEADETEEAGIGYHGEIDLEGIAAGHGRTRSFSRVIEKNYHSRHEEFYPRRLSFGEVEDAILEWESINSDIDEDELPPKIMAELIAEVSENVGSWVERKLTTVENLCQHLETNNLEELKSLHNKQQHKAHAMEDAARDILERQTKELKEMIREVETLGARLQYELGTVAGKVSDVEEAVGSFGRLVEEVEERVEGIDQMEKHGKKGWIEWIRGLVLSTKPSRTADTE